MPKFVYKGEAKTGESVEKTVEAEDRYAVYDIARKSDHTVLSIKEHKMLSLRGLLNVQKINVLISRVSGDEIVMLTRNLSAMLRAGLPLSRSLSISERQTKNPRLKKILASVKENINSGQQLHEAITEYPRTFSKLYVAMVRAGEESGGLSDALDTIGVQMERSSNLKKKIRGAMIYPSIIIIVMFIIGVLMMIFVVPTLTSTFKDIGVELPLTTRIIITISDFLSQNTILALGLMVGAVASLIALYRTSSGRRGIEWTLLRLPVIGGLVKETNAARTGRTLASLLKAGVDVVGALSITEDVVQNSYYQTIVHEAAVRVEKGKPLSEIFIEKERLYPVMFGEMVAVGEETGQIAVMLEDVADFFESEVERKTKDLSTIIEPVLMVIIGSVVGLFALAMIAPIYSISDSIG